MYSRILLIFAALLFSTAPAFSQGSVSQASNCPEGFNHVGTMSGSGSYGNPFNEVVEIRLPMNATVDKSFQQTKFRATNGRGNARSTLTGKNIPPGVYVVAYGSNDNDKGWAVTEPQLRIVQNPDGTRDYLFGVRLFCDVTIGESHIYGTCDVGVDLCYKPQVR